jgi:hypothetical protein
VTDSTQRRAERLARFDREQRRMAVLQRRAMLKRRGRRRIAKLQARINRT